MLEFQKKGKVIEFIVRDRMKEIVIEDGAAMEMVTKLNTTLSLMNKEA